MKYMFSLMILVLFIVGCTATEQEMVNEIMEDDMIEIEIEEEMMEDDSMAEIEKDDSMMEEANEEEIMEKDTMENEAMASYSGLVLAGEKTKYIDFNKADYDLALKEGKTILLYFYASWCPSCKNEQPKAHAGFDSLDDENIVGFRVNYRDSDTDDFEVELAKKYGISYQHTKVIIKNGERVLKSPESWSKDRYVEELTKWQS